MTLSARRRFGDREPERFRCLYQIAFRCVVLEGTQARRCGISSRLTATVRQKRGRIIGPGDWQYIRLPSGYRRSLRRAQALGAARR